MSDEKDSKVTDPEKQALKDELDEKEDGHATMNSMGDHELDSSKIKFINENGDAEAKVQVSIKLPGY